MLMNLKLNFKNLKLKNIKKLLLKWIKKTD